MQRGLISLNADTGLGLPDFRASERTFDLLSQVSGRAGRANKQGKVIIQTYNPDHYAIQDAKTHDYEKFFNQEMMLRRQASYPPYYYTVRLMASHPDLWPPKAGIIIFDGYSWPHPASDCPNEASLLLPNCHQI